MGIAGGRKKIKCINDNEVNEDMFMMSKKRPVEFIIPLLGMTALVFAFALLAYKGTCSVGFDIFLGVGLTLFCGTFIGVCNVGRRGRIKYRGRRLQEPLDLGVVCKPAPCESGFLHEPATNVLNRRRLIDELLALI